MWWLLWLADLIVVTRSDTSCDISCEKASYRCKRDLQGCGWALVKIFKRAECLDALGLEVNEMVGIQIRRPMAKTCPLTCVSAINNLTATNGGKAMETCNCNRVSTCLTVKARLKRCVLGRTTNYTMFSCTEARKRCNSNKDCKRIQESFLRRCTKLISGLECTKDCLDSQDELLNSDLGKALNDCECDGFEEPYCRGIRANYEELCVGPKEPCNSDASPTPAPTKYMVQKFIHSGQSRLATTQFELPVWILYAAITAYMFFNL